MRFKKVTMENNQQKITVDESSIVFDHSMTPLMRVSAKRNIRNTEPLANPPETVTDERDCQDSH